MEEVEKELRKRENSPENVATGFTSDMTQEYRCWLLRMTIVEASGKYSEEEKQGWYERNPPPSKKFKE